MITNLAIVLVIAGAFTLAVTFAVWLLELVSSATHRGPTGERRNELQWLIRHTIETLCDERINRDQEAALRGQLALLLADYRGR